MKAMKTLIAGSFAVAAASSAFAAETASTLTDAQRDEVRALVKEVLADADSRASLANGATGGIDSDGKVFLRSEDGKYSMNIGGAVQTRYVWHSDKGNLATDSSQGFDLPYITLNLSGRLGDSVGYRVQLSRIPSLSNQLSVEQAYGTYALDNNWSVKAGKFYLPYARESLIASSDQVTVADNGSQATAFFGLGRADGVQLEYASDMLRTRGALSNGGNSEDVNFPAFGVEYAASGRVDLLVAGSDKTGMDSFNDNFALRDGSGKQGLLLGAAAYYQDPKGLVLAGGRVANQYGATVDATWKIANLAFYGAGFVAHDTIDNVHSSTPWGAVAQADVGVTRQLDVFGQYNIVMDGAGNGNIAPGNNAFKAFQSFVVGANYHVNSHVKLTGDVVWVYSGDGAYSSITPGGSAPTGTNVGLGSGVAGEVAVRLQAQVSF